MQILLCLSSTQLLELICKQNITDSRLKLKFFSMKHTDISLDKARLENIFSQPEQKQVEESKLFSALKAIWQHLLTTLTNNNELQIWQTTDQLGNTWWNGYDPATGRFTSLATEAEMRIWIEERYYQ